MFVHCFLIKKHIYFNQSLLNLSVLIFKSNDVNGDCNLNVTSWTISNLETLFFTFPSFFPTLVKVTTALYSCNGWLGIKHQVTYCEINRH